MPDTDELWVGNEGADEDGYPRRHVDKVALVALVRARQFVRAERFMERVQSAFEQDYHNENWTAQMLAAFDSADPELGAALDAWLTSTPNHWAVHAARGAHLKAVAWARRGSLYAHKTSRAQFAGMEESARLASDSYERAVALRPKLLAADAELILLAQQTHQTELDANAYLERALAKCPECLLARVDYLIMLKPIWGGSIERLERSAMDLSAGQHQNRRLHELRAFPDAVRCDVARRRDQTAEGISHCEKAVAMAPRFTEILIMYADALEKLKRYNEAARALEDALVRSPQRGDILEQRAWYLRRERRLEQATRELLTARRLDPVDPGLVQVSGALITTLVAAGHQARVQGDFPRADQLFSWALELDPDHADAKQRKLEAARARQTMQGNEAQIAALTARLDASPDDFELRRRLDALYVQSGTLQPIVTMWNTFLKAHPDHAAAYFERAGTYRLLRDMEHALADANRACQLGLQAACAVVKRAPDTTH